MTSEQADRRHPPLWIALAAVALAFVASQVLGVIAVVATGSSTSHLSPLANNINNFVFDGCFVGAALYFTLVGGWMGRDAFGYVRIPWRRGAAAVLAGGAIYYVVTLVYAAVFKLHGKDQLPSGLGLRHTGWAIVVGLFVAAVAPMAEEFFFRGFLFGILRRMRLRVGERDFGPWLAAAIVGLLFGLAHFDSAQPEFLIPLGFLGFLLCIMRWRTGSLYPGMVLHSVNNAVAFGVNEQLGWGAADVALLMVGSLALIALVTGPLAVSRSAVVADP
jgi:membrane protease YdiL (CAAX protease family)